MSPRLTLATTRRVVNQLRRDPRTVALMVLLPTLLIILFRYVLNSQAAFNAVIPTLLCIFPFNIMFVVTSVATLRERTTGTLERLMTLPIGKIDLLAGYALAFGRFAVIEVGWLLRSASRGWASQSQARWRCWWSSPCSMPCLAWHSACS